MLELSENDLLEMRKTEKRKHLLDNSSSILGGLSRLLVRKRQAQLTLEEAERDEAALFEKQRAYNQLLSQRDTVAQELRLTENMVVELQNGIKRWNETVLANLFSHHAHALDVSTHASVQILLLRTRLDVLPIAAKRLRERQAELKSEIIALEKSL